MKRSDELRFAAYRRRNIAPDVATLTDRMLCGRRIGFTGSVGDGGTVTARPDTLTVGHPHAVIDDDASRLFRKGKGFDEGRRCDPRSPDQRARREGGSALRRVRTEGDDAPVEVCHLCVQPYVDSGGPEFRLGVLAKC